LEMKIAKKNFENLFHIMKNQWTKVMNSSFLIKASVTRHMIKIFWWHSNGILKW
jgi:hypothetical protein